ncbi:hypothetical protein JI721_05315 [Alicyclobacillus cycloheptanicus]|uniref:Transcriptional regulator with XRE-family HTH domain n=1 Tax=Alicyclobacillus cycloheptanicus TaxID=1457 RepID=A0ABT9XMR7_9BACL|nr:hypothetical protein [Alicyclobacillus cycloheptanicus]MDQ0191587.1 transcriptional regulator with XRE-family HTH domain [Alicyclobacillus cycloheptanicus]WDM02235.1 hypothetical protein JI721_05315 [Alicyclobacillus cycloheptanicus]
MNEVQRQARIQQVLSSLEAGLSRDQIAEVLGIDRKSLDQFMRRNHFPWDNIYERYVKKPQEQSFRRNPDRFQKSDRRARSIIDA